ncbi:PR domain zinc finger protein 10 [Biomphalaria pfeifferi]|uniref:PR domain zinc finger protein 10 n=1 Tax=Biomphalaria pfeifferi TaxID=112525 RepID=A0AAD8BIV4_BIOPF|nr:PR domain zinc finger protein 10 [Biomphalaria pfeifferi]
MQESGVTVSNTAEDVGTDTWCEECGVSNIGECLIHGGNMIRAHDTAPPPKAYLSLPKILAIKRAKSFDICSLEARKGVFAKKTIKIRTLFGPLEAVVTQTKPRLSYGALEFEIHRQTGERLYLDTSDKYKCNWMIFVRPASKFSQQNLAAFENNGQIFFVTCKNIPAGTELRVWYSAAYAKSMGKSCLMPDLLDIVNVEKKGQDESQSLKVVPQKIEDKVCVEQSHLISEVKDEKLELNSQLLTDTFENVQQVDNSDPSLLIKKDNNVFSCFLCSASFARIRQLESHVCTVFRDKIETQESNPRRRKGKPKKISDNSQELGFGMPNLLGPYGLNNNSSEDVILPNDLNEDLQLTDHLLLPETLADTLEDTSRPDTNQEKTRVSEDVKPKVLESVKPKGRRGRPRKFPVKDKSSAKSNIQPHSQKKFSCSSCDATFVSKEQWLQHKDCAPTMIVCKYENCSKVFATKYKYHRHKIIHEKPNNFQCHFCQSKFNRLDHLKNHLLVHDMNRSTFACDICGKSYLYKSTLIFHKAKHEAVEGNSLFCLVCKQGFPSKEELKKHINVHNRYKREEKPRKMSCPDCGKQFLTQKDIRRHRVTHSKERPFLCEHCPHTFVRKDHLRRHYSSSHKKELYEQQLKSNPFGCSICLEAFNKQEFLAYHIKTVHPNGGDKVEPKQTKEKVVKTLSKSAAVKVVSIPSAQESISKTDKGSIAMQKLLLKRQAPSKQPLLQSQPNNLPGQSLLPPQLQPSPHSSQASESQSCEPYPVSLIKIHPSEPVIAGTQPVFFPSSLQTTNTQATVLDAIGVDLLAQTSKAPAPFRVHNQVLSQVQLQAPTRSHIQLENQQLQQQQQEDQLQHVHQVQQPRQQHHLQQQQQYTTSSNCNAVQQLQIQQLLLPQHFSVQQQPQQQTIQSVGHVIQGIKLADFQNILIALDGQNLVSLQGLNISKPVQHMVVKDTTLGCKQLLQIPVQEPAPKSESSFFINCNGQIFQATVDNPTIAQLLNNSSSKLDLKQIQVLEDDFSRIVGQSNSNCMKSTGVIKSPSQNVQSQSDSLLGQQQLQDDFSEAFSSQVQAQLLPQQPQGHVQQNQILDKSSNQDLSSFSVPWADNFDFKPVGEMSIPADVTSSTLDNLNLSQGSCWILQQQPQSLDQQPILQVQNQQSSHLFTLSTACTIADS